MSLITLALTRYRTLAERWERQNHNDPRRGFSPSNPYLSDLLAAQAVARMRQSKEVSR